jgi:hypothetical protein
VSSSRADGHPLRFLSAQHSSSQPLRDREAEKGKARRKLPSLSAALGPRPSAAPTPYRRRTMSFPFAASPPPPAADEERVSEAVAPAAADEKVASSVDPFLVEALDNPRHRLVGESRA